MHWWQQCSTKLSDLEFGLICSVMWTQIGYSLILDFKPFLLILIVNLRFIMSSRCDELEMVCPQNGEFVKKFTSLELRGSERRKKKSFTGLFLMFLSCIYKNRKNSYAPDL